MDGSFRTSVKSVKDFVIYHSCHSAVCSSYVNHVRLSLKVTCRASVRHTIYLVFIGAM